MNHVIHRTENSPWTTKWFVTRSSISIRKSVTEGQRKFFLMYFVVWMNRFPWLRFPDVIAPMAKIPFMSNIFVGSAKKTEQIILFWILNNLFWGQKCFCLICNFCCLLNIWMVPSWSYMNDVRSLYGDCILINGRK